MSEVADICAPVAGVKYPVKVEYCPNCSMPFEVFLHCGQQSLKRLLNPPNHLGLFFVFYYPPSSGISSCVRTVLGSYCKRHSCHPAPCYKVFLLLSDRYHNPEQGFEPESSSECLHLKTCSKPLGHHGRSELFVVPKQKIST